MLFRAGGALDAPALIGLALRLGVGSTSAESPTSPTRSTDRTHAFPSTLAIRLKNSDSSKSATSMRSHSPDLRSTDTFHFTASPSKPS